MLIRKNDSGRSIVEMLGVLAIMGVITVMGISGYSQAIGRINRNKVVEEITKIAQEVRGLFAGRDSYDPNTGTETGTGTAGYDIADNLLKKMKFKLDTPYGGKYIVKSFGSAGNNPGFYVTVENVPMEDCLHFTTMAWTDVLNADHQTPGNSAYVGAGPDTSTTVCPLDTASSITVYFR